jgi:hypothetical protein
MTSKRLENATATGRPTYPRPHTAILFTTGDLTVFVVSKTLEIDTRGHEIDAESNMFAPVRAGVLLKNIYSSILD